ncbi:hypothetical protein [Nonomuraea sp. LPB2021202275-12-8]|uniref:hypothetical protein n=1 Tax=Nonomuraea sp. LPB2021202275-12-8 TaxID=3120159 RepID=UPI00300C7135
MTLVLGVDAGGTSTRTAVFTLDGCAVGRGSAAGGNPGAVGFDQACANVSAAVLEALVERVFGADRRQRPAHDSLPPIPGNAVVRPVGDVVTAFSAGSDTASGTVLISGTGAIAAKITNHTVTATADGHCWPWPSWHRW